MIWEPGAQATLCFYREFFEQNEPSSPLQATSRSGKNPVEDVASFVIVCEKMNITKLGAMGRWF